MIEDLRIISVANEIEHRGRPNRERHCIHQHDHQVHDPGNDQRPACLLHHLVRARHGGHEGEDEQSTHEVDSVIEIRAGRIERLLDDELEIRRHREHHQLARKQPWQEHARHQAPEAKQQEHEARSAALHGKGRITDTIAADDHRQNEKAKAQMTRRDIGPAKGHG